MYLEYFGLKELPFRLTPDTDFLYMSSAHARAKAYMDYTVWNREGFVVITGEIGCGKTTLIQKLLSELDEESVLVAKIFQTQLDEVEFLQAVLVEFGLNPFSAKKVELIDMLNTFLVESFAKRKQLVLVVDDAHNLSTKALEEIRMLSGLETQKEKLLHIILVGQPQLNDVIEAPEMEQLLQRVRLRYHIKPLSEHDTADYIVHRLKVAGAGRDDIFAPETIGTIHKFTGGTPRLINTLCDTALVCAYADSVQGVSAEVIQAAVDELQWLPYARRAQGKRHRERAKGHGPAHGDAAERERLIANIGNRLNQMDSLAPALALMSDRLMNIESLLRSLVDVIRETHTSEQSRKSVRSDR
jgi:general secretion pathway protein A